MFHKYMYILYLLFKSKDESHGGGALVMPQKQQDKRRAMLRCDRLEGEMHPSGEIKTKKVLASLYVYQLGFSHN